MEYARGISCSESARWDGRELSCNISPYIAEINFFLDLADRWQGRRDIEMEAVKTAEILLGLVFSSGRARRRGEGLRSRSHFFRNRN